MTEPFIGAKLAILVGKHLVAILRDDIASIPYPDHWDLPGGGREGQETPEETVLRETEEEIGITFAQPDLVWSKGFSSGDSKDWLFVTEQPDFDPDRIRFGDEGQYWRIAPIDWFIFEARAVPNQQERLQKYMASRESAKS
ncbi:MAG: NUDIX domain-containing protein [Boseongicola sp.]